MTLEVRVVADRFAERHHLVRRLRPMRRMKRRYLVAVGTVVAGVATALAITVTASGGGPNYVPAPTIACLRADGFAISWGSPPYRFRPASDWASIRVSGDGYVLDVTLAPSPALARQMAPTSGFITTDPWIRRNVVFSNHAGPEDGPIAGCLRGPRGR
jgi:hypothetical protein